VEQRKTTLSATLQFMPTDKGGRNSAVASGYRPQFYFEGADYDCRVAFAVDVVQPGDVVTATIELSEYASSALAGQVCVGKRFTFREGQQQVVTETIERLAEGVK
jgi:translation elongation factor EF-Tu-like GTPase